jgi:cytidyltransferase-like protein
MISTENPKGTIVITSGYFDPLHVGHIEYLELAKHWGDYLIAIVNNNNQALLKSGGFLMDQFDRLKIVGSLGIVDSAHLSIDKGQSVKDTVAYLRQQYPDNKMIFANGGDRPSEGLEETQVCADGGIELIDGLGDKIRSSSDFRNYSV